MRKLLSIAVLLMFSIIAHAQSVTQFLGIPVDGSKSEMIKRLKEKGYKYDATDDVLIGEFNGVNVRISIGTNNNKVCRIMICDATPIDERAIQIRFNKLCKQFADNPKYTILQDETIIPDNENISYEMTVNNKRYEALFYQVPDDADVTAIIEKLRPTLLSKYTSEQIINQTEKFQSELMDLATPYIIESFQKKPVWFMINDFYGKYYITMYYDNEYNRADGSDL